MKTLLILFLAIISSQIWAKNIELKITTVWKQDGFEQITKQTTLNAKLGDKLIIPISEGTPFKFEIQADQLKDAKTVSLKGDVSEGEDELEKVISSPVIVTAIGQETLFSSVDKNDEHFELKVLPLEVK